MRTLSIIIYCLLTVAASLLFLIQGSRRPRFIRFYRSMAEKEWARKGFILILAASAIAWNFACFISYGNSPWLLPGLALSLSLLSYRLTHAVLCIALHDRGPHHRGRMPLSVARRDLGIRGLGGRDPGGA